MRVRYIQPFVLCNRRYPAHPVSVLILHPNISNRREILVQALYDTLILVVTRIRTIQRHFVGHRNAVKGAGNAMPCHRTGCDRHNIRTPATQIPMMCVHQKREKRKTRKERKEKGNGTNTLYVIKSSKGRRNTPSMRQDGYNEIRQEKQKYIYIYIKQKASPRTGSQPAKTNKASFVRQKNS